MTISATISAKALEPASAQLLNEAVHQHSGLSAAAMLERAFTLAFRTMVYAQIWEDPRVDLEALELTPQSRIVTIASGGCNVMSYLTADPARIYAVDLNNAHIALLHLKLAALRHLPSQPTFYRFFGGAADHHNAALYDQLVAPHLDQTSRAYWEGRDLSLRRRITRFSRNFYRYGLLGRFIGLSHIIARGLGVNPERMLAAKSLKEQRAIFDAELAPVFNSRFLKWLTSNRASLFGLGIPPAQYDALCDYGARPMTDVLKERVERLATNFDIRDNYFAWQAFARRYDRSSIGPVPPYLDACNYSTIKARANRVTVLHENLIHFLKTQPAASLDRYVLLDAQDWMDDATLTSLWSEITRTSPPNARVIFRTAGKASILPGRVPAALLDQWHYQAARSAELFAADRSAIYGGFHLYTKSA